MKQQKNTITDEEFYKDTGVNPKNWDENEKIHSSLKTEKEQEKTSKLKDAWNKIVVIGIFAIVIGLVIFFIWGFFFYENYHGSSDTNDFLPDYMGGVH